MSIIVGKIENKFWRNGSYKQPNNFPVYSIQKEFKNKRPSLTSFMGGNIYLQGGEGNHCIYEGGYYAMYILKVIDKKKGLYHYRLERELGFDVLAANAEVIGDLMTSNNDKLLEANLNRTFGTLDTPAKLTVINFDEKESEQKGNNFEFIKSTLPIEEYLISKTAFEAFDDRAKNGDSEYGKKEVEKYYYEHRNPAVFILSYLYATKITNGGKSKLRDKVNQFVQDVKNNDAPFRISKINDLPNSPLQGKFAITYKVDGIGSGTEKLKIDKIDLSELKDIRPVHNLTLEEMTPNTDIHVADNFSGGVFEIPESREDTRTRYLGKITKKAHLPNQSYIMNAPDGCYDMNSHRLFNWTNIKKPQEITGKDSSRPKSFLYYLDNLNLTLSFDKRYGDTSNAYVASSGYGGEIGTVGQVRQWAQNTGTGKLPTPWVSNEFIQNTHRTDIGADPYRDLGRDTFIRFGFLIYQIYRRQLDWRLFEYRGSITLENIKYISGIRRNFVNEYTQSGQWGSSSCVRLQPDSCSLLSRFYLDNYLFSWLSFMPDDGGYNVSYHYYDPYGIKKGMPASNYYYTYDIIRADVHHPTNSSLAVSNPWTPSRVTNFVVSKEEKLERDIFLFTTIKPNKKIEKGDYFFTDQEYSIEFSRASAFHQGSGKPNDRWERNGLKMAIKAEDFAKSHEDHLLDSLDKFVVLCSTLDGNFEIRTVEKHRFTQYLAKGNDQIIAKVDGQEARPTTFYHLKKLFRFGELDKITHTKGLSDEIKNAAITALYKLHDYKIITNNRGVTAGNYFSDDVLKDSNQKIWFELVGTSGYCLLHKGKVHLVANDDTPFSSLSTKVHAIQHEKIDVEIDDPDNPGTKKTVKDYKHKPTLLEKVNQQVRLQFHNVPYHLTGKTSFTDADNVTLQYESSKISGLVSEFNHYFVSLESGFDRIGWEEVPVPKVVVQSKALADDLQREALQFNLIQSRFNYDLNQERYRLAERRFHENITRAQNALDIQKQTAGWKALSDLVVHTTSAHVLAKKDKAGMKVPALMSRDVGTGSYYIEEGGKKMLKNYTPKYLAMPNPSQNPIKEITIPEMHGGMKRIQIPSAVSAAVGSAVNSAINIGLDMALNGPEQQRKIDMDRQLGAEDLAVQSLTMETAHMERQLQAQIALNNLSNRYSTPSVSQSNLMEEYRKKFGKEKRKVKVGKDTGKKNAQNNPIFEEVEEEREVAILNPVHLAVFTPTKEQLDYLKEQKEEYGIMCDIKDISTDFFPGMPADILRYSRIEDEGIKNLTNPIVRGYLYNRMTVGTKIVDVRGQVVISSESRAQIESKIIGLYESLKQQEATSQIEKDELNKKITELENFLLNKTTQHQEKLKEIEELNKQLQKLNQDLEEQKQKAKDCEDVGAEQLKEIEKLEEEIKQCKVNLTNLEQAKETCDRINAAEQKKLTAEVGTLKQQLAERTREKENLNNLKQDLERQLRECLDKPKEPAEVEELKKQLADQTKKAETLQNKVADLTVKLDAATLPNECELLHNMIRPIYQIDVQERPTGSKAEALCQYLAHQLKEIEQNEVYRHVSQYPKVKEIMDLINEFESIKAIYIFRDGMGHNAWPQYLEYKKTGKKEGAEIDELIGIMEEVKYHLKSSHLHALKAILDELAFKMYKAKDIHSVKNKKDPDNPDRDVSDIDIDENLQFLFGSFIGGGKILYKDLYGEEVEWAIKRKLFYEAPCVQDGIPSLQFINNLDRGTHYVTASIPVGNAPPEAHFLFDNWVELGNLKDLKPVEFVTMNGKEGNSGGYREGDKGIVLVISNFKTGYRRYGSNKSGSGMRYFSGMNVKLVEHVLGRNDTVLGLTDMYTDIEDGIYLHGSGQLTPEVFFKKRIENGKKVIQEFHKAISHEDLRDRIKREKKLNIKFRKFLTYTHNVGDDNLQRGKSGLQFSTKIVEFDLVAHFGTRDAYQALGILTVLSNNGLYINKVGQGNDGGKYRIQPHSHPFHQIDVQEVIEDMTKIADQRKNANLFTDFVDLKNLVVIISFLIKGNYSVLEMPKTLEFLKKLDISEYYTGSQSEDADSNDGIAD